LREDGARLLLLVIELNGNETSAQRVEHWKRLTPGIKGTEWRLPTWLNVFPKTIVKERDDRSLNELRLSRREHLLRFVESWFIVGRNFRQWVKEYPLLAASLDESSKHIRVRFQPLWDGGLQAVTTIEPPVQVRTECEAAAMFGDYFLRNPLREVLAGRCKRCRRYFFNRRGNEQMVYCSQKCRWDAHNAKKGQSRERDQQKMENSALAEMRKLLTDLNTSGELIGKPWKNRVVAVVNKKHGVHFESKWLTRTINAPNGKYHKLFIRVRDAIEQRLAAASHRISNTEEDS
jgi:hypothetical protein